jgi:nitrogen fixation NifU-like protein
MSNTLYQDLLVEHFKYPENKKELPQANFTVHEHNPSCGDRISMQGIITDNILSDVGFGGSGCVISQASASMLTQDCLGKSITAILALTPEYMTALVGIPLGPTRLKCALISLQALQQGLREYTKQ